MHEPKKGLQRFEELSHLIKEGKDLKDFLKVEDLRTYQPVASDLTGYVDKVKPHFAIPQPDDEGVIPQADPIATEMPDLLADS